MKTAKQIIESKIHFNNVIRPSDKVLNALHVMKKEDVSYIIVMDDNEHYIGILDEKEYAHNLISNGDHANEMSVKELLHTIYPAIDADDNSDNCIKLMSCYKLRYLPVFEGFNFIGVVTENDLLEEVAREKAIE